MKYAWHEVFRFFQITLRGAGKSPQRGEWEILQVIFFYQVVGI